MKSITGEGAPDGLQCVIDRQSGCWGCGARDLDMNIRGKYVRNYVEIYEEENMNVITCSSSM